jgi:transcriptional regulator with XRE-family HTH domain
MTSTERDARERFVANVENLCRRNGLSVEELAKRSQVDRGELTKILRREGEADASVISMVAGALGVDPGALFQGVSWVPPAKGGTGYVIEDPDGD